ncbi:MAG: lipase family protein [Anaeromyxobacteraceae bacterium]
MTLRQVLAVVALVAASACSSTPRKPDAFYDPPSMAGSGKPGEVLRIEPVTDGPEGARSFRLLYLGTGGKGEPAAISAMLVVPDGPAPAGGRDVVAWAHPTTGVVQDCAPSLQPDWRKTIAGLDLMVKAGLVVVATDYPGLGAPGTHAYLVGRSEAQAVVDSVRAARNVKEAEASSRFAVWGHSQGGHAAIFTGELAGKLAPELTLVGVAAAAPATDLVKLLTMDLGSTLGNVLAAEALLSWSKVFDAPLSSVVVPDAIPTVERVGKLCIRNEREGLVAFHDSVPLRDGFVAKNLAATPPWGEIMRENSTGASPVGAPVFVAQGTIDDVVNQRVTAEWAGKACAQGTPVKYLSMPDEAHYLVAFHGAREAVDWMVDRFAGKPAPDECVRERK